MSERTFAVQPRRGGRLCFTLLGSFSFIMVLLLPLFTPHAASAAVTLDNGRLLIHLPAHTPLHLQQTGGALLLSSPTGIWLDGDRTPAATVPAAATATLILGSSDQTLSLQLEPGTDLTVHDDTAVLTLHSAANLTLTAAQLTRSLTIKMAQAAPDQLTLGHLHTNSLTIHGGHVAFTGPVTTAHTITLSDNRAVRITAPLSAPAGIASRSAALTMALGGALTAAEGDIMLAAQALSLQESRLQAAGDLALQAADTLTIRDSADRPFLAQAGGQLWLQGISLIDISALAHPASALTSGGDMRLRSANPVRGDALYLSGGQVQIAQLNGRSGDLLSPHDPIVLANGDVSLGSYSGASLHIVAGGSVLLDSVTITGTDSTANTINAANTTVFNGSDTIADLANVSLSDGTAIAIDGSAQPLLDVRAGVDWTTFAGGAPANQISPPGAVTPAFAPASGAAITINGLVNVSQPAGLVLLTNQYRPNAVLTGGINTDAVNVSATGAGQHAGAILIDARGDVSAGQLDAFAEVAGTAVTVGDGGDIMVLAPAGSISSSGDLNTYARVPANSSGAAGAGGAIRLAAATGIDINGGSSNVNSFAFANSDGDAGDGGPVALTTSSGDIAVRMLNSSSSVFTSTVASSNGGNMLLATGNGRITVAGDGFFSAVSTFAQSPGPGGSGGSVIMTATQGIAIGQAVRVQGSGLNANGGSVQLHSSGGDISVGDIAAFAAFSGEAGRGGSVSLTALDGAVRSGDIQTFANAFFLNNDARDGGRIIIQALNGDVQTGALESYSEARGLDGDTGDAGSITITASGSLTAAGNVRAYALAAQNNSNSGLAGNGGAVTLQVTGAISIGGRVDAFSSAPGANGAAANGGPIMLAAATNVIGIAGDVNSYANAPGFPSGDAGNGGSLSLTAGAGIDTAGQWNTYAFSQAGTVGSGGHISAVSSSGDIVLAAANASAWNPFADSSLGTGDGGDIRLSTGAGQISVNPDGIGVFAALNAQSAGADITGAGGNIVLTATQGIRLNGAVWAQASGAAGHGGRVALTTGDGDILTGDVIATAVDNNGSPGSGGHISLQALNGAVSSGNVWSFSHALFINNPAQDGGDITITALNGDVNMGGLASYSEARGLLGDTGSGGDINVTSSGSINATDAVQAYALAAINNFNSGAAGSGGAVQLQAGGDITVAGSLDTFSAAPGPGGTAVNAGNVTLAADGNIAFTYLDARSRAATGTMGAGGTVDIRSDQFVRASDVTADSSESITAAGLANSSAITLTHGGAGSTPFIVGDAAVNGAAGALSTGDALISPTASFLYSHFEAPNIWILSTPQPLTLSKSATPDIDVVYHGEITYTVRLSNATSRSAVAVSLTDTLPAEVNFNRWVQQPAGAAVTADVLTWHGDVPANSAVTFEFVVNHGGEAGDVFTNTAVFDHPVSLGGGEAAATVSIEAAADVSLTKTADAETAVPGETIQYTLAYANAGPGVARGVVITDIVPAALTNVRVSSSGALITPTGGADFVWSVPNLAAGQGGVITITGELAVPLARDRAVENTAVISTAVFESDVSNNAEAVIVTVLNAAPQAEGDSAVTNEDTAVLITVLANDTDLNDDNLTLDAVGAPGSGSAVIAGDTVDYTPALNFNGTDVFTYTVSDGQLSSTTAVTVAVLPVNDAPQFTSTPGINAQTDVLYSYAVAVADVDSAQLSIQGVTLPPWLTLADQGGGTAVLSGTPGVGDVGDHPVQLQVSDGVLTDTQAFTLTVSAAPVTLYVYLPFVTSQTAVPVPPADLVITDVSMRGNDVAVTIHNQGTGPTSDDFWVDLYVNPSAPPELNQTWQIIAEHGAAWGVTEAIPSKGTLQLTVNDAYFDPAQSDFPGLTPGDVVWAQVDAVNLATTYGNILEADEMNNVYGPVVSTAVLRETAVPR